MAVFSNPNDPDLSKTKATLSDWLRQAKAYAADTPIAIVEQRCSEPSCIHTETVFKVCLPEETVFYTVPKPLVFIRKWDIIALQPKNSTPPTHKHQ